MSTLAIVELVMRETRSPMSVRDIVDSAGDSLPSRSKTPDTVVARDLSMDIKRLGDESRFVRTAPGRYTMREFITSGIVKMGDCGPRPLALRHQTSSESARPESTDVSATPMLSSALRDGRHGILPAPSLQRIERSRDVSEA